MTNNYDKILKEYKKLKFIEKYLNDGWIIYKKKDKYYLLKNKDIFKNKNINLTDLFNTNLE
tara:strand:+ start:4459 stop:4641 length:183 start_codon:yes stop_codon:yes gene_type:complete